MLPPRPETAAGGHRLRFARHFQIVALAAGITAGCGAPPGVARDVVVDWPQPAAAFVTGVPTPVEFRLLDAARAPVSGAILEVEAHMSHPGMAPVIERVVERGDGVYAANLAFTMAGDWTVLVTGSLRDGRRIRQQAATVAAAAAVN